MQTKVCSKCGEEKALGGFYADKSGRLGRSARCCECTKAQVNAYRKSNAETIKERKRQEYLKNPAPYRERSKARYWANPGQARDYSKSWRKENPEKARVLSKRNKKTQAGIEREARYREKHLDRIRSLNAERVRQGAEALSDQYVTGVICARTPLRHSDIPLSLVEAKRVQLQIKRLLKERKA